MKVCNTSKAGGMILGGKDEKILKEGSKIWAVWSMKDSDVGKGLSLDKNKTDTEKHQTSIGKIMEALLALNIWKRKEGNTFRNTNPVMEY